MRNRPAIPRPRVDCDLLRRLGQLRSFGGESEFHGGASRELDGEDGDAVQWKRLDHEVGGDAGNGAREVPTGAAPRVSAQSSAAIDGGEESSHFEVGPSRCSPFRNVAARGQHVEVLDLPR